MLGRQTGGGPSLIISAAGCPHLVRAMSGGYRFKTNTQGGLNPVPEKNDPTGYSHVADCLQYVCLAFHGGMLPHIMTRLRAKTRPTAPPFTSRAWT